MDPGIHVLDLVLLLAGMFTVRRTIYRSSTGTKVISVKDHTKFSTKFSTLKRRTLVPDNYIRSFPIKSTYRNLLWKTGVFISVKSGPEICIQIYIFLRQGVANLGG